MKNKLNTIAIILASGLGQRFDETSLKQYQIINNKAVIHHSVNIFNIDKKIDKVIEEYKIKILIVCFRTSLLLNDKKFVRDFFRLSS